MPRLLYILPLLLLACAHQVDTSTVVAPQPFEGCKREYVDAVKKRIEEYYGAQTIVLEEQPMPKKFFVNIKSPRYRADSIIAYLKETKADSIDYVIGLTHHDISATKRNNLGYVKEPKEKYEDWGIFGLGYRPGPSSVVSYFRIKGETEAQTLERLEKISIHEIGHNLGLPHCTHHTCVMHDAAEKISTIDKVDKYLCDDCKKKVH